MSFCATAVLTEGGGTRPVSFSACTGGTSITAGGTNQVLTAAGEAANGLYVQNPLLASDQGIGAAEALTVELVSVGNSYPATSVKLQPGDSFSTIVPASAAIYVSAASAGHKFSAFHW